MSVSDRRCCTVYVIKVVRLLQVPVRSRQPPKTGTPAPAAEAPRQAWAAPAPAPAHTHTENPPAERGVERGRREARARRFEYWTPNGDGAPRPRKSVLQRQQRADEYSERLRQDQQAKRAAERAEAEAEVQRLEEMAKQAARRHQAAHDVRKTYMPPLHTATAGIHELVWESLYAIHRSSTCLDKRAVPR